MLTRRSLLAASPALAVTPTAIAIPSLEEIAERAIDHGGGDIIISRCSDCWMVTGYLHGQQVTAAGQTIQDGLLQLTEKMRQGIVDPERDVSKYLPAETEQPMFEELLERCEPHRVVFGAGRNFDTGKVESWYAFKRIQYPMPQHEIVYADETPYKAMYALWEKLGKPNANVSV